MAYVSFYSLMHLTVALQVWKMNLMAVMCQSQRPTVVINTTFQGDFVSDAASQWPLDVIPKRCALRTEDRCTEVSVCCNPEGWITDLVFKQKGRLGTIPTSIGSLKMLESLNFADNKITGSLPTSIGYLTNLISMDFNNNNNLTGSLPSSIGNLRKLQLLDFYDNDLHGSVPDSFRNLTNLSFLRLSYNNLEGRVLNTMTSLTNLTFMDLSRNNFSGTIPSAITRLTKLFFFDISRNQNMHGLLPDFIGKFPNLGFFDISYANFGGSIPNSLSSLRNLTFLHLAYDHFNGTISTSLLTLTQLKRLELTNNELSGTIPNSISNLTRLTFLSFGANEFSGPVLDLLGSLTSLTHLNLSYNSFQGTVPSFIAHFQNLTTLDISYNNFSGEIPRSIAHLKEIQILRWKSSNQSAPWCPARFTTSARSPFCTGQCVSSTDCAVDSCIGACMKPRKLPIILGSSAGAILLILILLVPAIYLHRRMRHGRWNPTTNCCQFSFRAIEKATNHFSKDRFLGEGGYGEVFRGVGPDGRLWAVKRAKEILKESDFQKEVKTIAKINHKNIVHLIGYCNELRPETRQHEQILVYEFVSNGNLQKQLHQPNAYPLTFRQRLDIAIDVAEALRHFHHLATPALVHRDIKPENILLDDNMQAKIADFGITKEIGGTSTGGDIQTVAGTLGYLDVEYLHEKKISTTIDVYSFGIVLLGLVTGRTPSTTLNDTNEALPIREWVKLYLLEDNVWEMVDPTLQLSKEEVSEKQVEEIIRLGLACTYIPSSERPTMDTVAHMLKSFKETLYGPGITDPQSDNDFGEWIKEGENAIGKSHRLVIQKTSSSKMSWFSSNSMKSGISKA